MAFEVPPVITILSPGDGDVDVAKDTPIKIRITDDKEVYLWGTEIYVRGTPVFLGSGGDFSTGYKHSYYETNTGNGWDFTIVPDRTMYWVDGEVISVRVVAAGRS